MRPQRKEGTTGGSLTSTNRRRKVRKNIVVSAINLRSGGTLSILKDCLTYLSGDLSHKYNIVALVHSEKLINVKNITYYEFPVSIKSYVRRIYYEYIDFRRFSKKINPYLWLSLHDITPNVKTDILAVYCHNPSPFYKLSLKEVMLDQKFVLFNLFYKYLYMINIKKMILLSFNRIG